MDNVTHSLTALALARSGLGRLTPRGTLLLLISANLPDIDMISLFWGGLTNLETHRGYTHSLLVIPVMAAVAVALTALLSRSKLPWGRAFGVAVAGVASHLLLDWTNSYGIRLLLPLTSEWFFLDINYLYDFVILAALSFAALWPLLARLVSDEIGERKPAGPGMAIFALLFFVAYDGARYVMHQRAMAQLDSRLYGQEAPTRLAAMPEPLSPLNWLGIVETPSAFHTVPVSSLTDFDPTAGRTFYKGDWLPIYDVASQTEPFRYLRYYARFPLWRSEPATLGDSIASQPGERVTLTDLRFGAPPGPAVAAEALVDRQHHMVESGLTFFGRKTNK
jgi:inner membrane protein